MRRYFSANVWKYLSFVLIGVIGAAILVPYASAATKEIHQQLMDAIAGQDNIVPVHFEAKGNVINNLRLTPTSVDGYSGRISFTAGAADDVNGDGQYTPADCDAKIRIDYDTDNDDQPDLQGMDADLKGGIQGAGFITIGGAPGAEVDGIYLSITDVSASESCGGTVVLLLSKTVT